MSLHTQRADLALRTARHTPHRGPRLLESSAPTDSHPPRSIPPSVRSFRFRAARVLVRFRVAHVSVRRTTRGGFSQTPGNCTAQATSLPLRKQPNTRRGHIATETHSKLLILLLLLLHTTVLPPNRRHGLPAQLHSRTVCPSRGPRKRPAWLTQAPPRAESQPQPVEDHVLRHRKNPRTPLSPLSDLFQFMTIQPKPKVDACSVGAGLSRQ
jgi:hypothetical protein